MTARLPTRRHVTAGGDATGFCPATPRRIRWWVAVLPVMAFAFVLTPAVAVAHTQLLVTSPGDGAVLEDGPTEVVLTFNEPVEAVGFEPLRVLTDDGERIDDGTWKTSPDRHQLTIPLGPGGDGTHTVAWEVVSADGHPIRGAFVFHVGAPTSNEAALAEVEESHAHNGGTAPSRSSTAVRWTTYVASLSTIGLVVVGALLGVRPALASTVRTVALATAAASLAQILLYAMETTNLGPRALVSLDTWRTVTTSSLSQAATLRAVGGLFVASTTGRRPLWGLASVPMLVLAELLTGHTRTVVATIQGWAADAVHVTAGGVWFGGLLAVALTINRRAISYDPPLAAQRLERFSSLAAWSVAAIGASGAVLTFSLVGTPRAAVTTAYGWTLLAKTGTAGIVLGIAAYNRWSLVPAIRRDPHQHLSRLARTVHYEMVGITIALGLTAALVDLPPASITADRPVVASADLEDLALTVAINPGRAGTNVVHIYFETETGFPALVTGETTVDFNLPSQNLGPITRTPAFAGAGVFEHVGPELAIAGEWEITVRRRLSPFEETSVTVPVTIRR